MTQEIVSVNKLKQEHSIANEFENRCTQLQCTFYIKGGCQSCLNCKAGPYNITKGCEACHHCVNTPGALRFVPEVKE